MNKKNVALIGYGYWGKKIFKYLQESGDFKVKYVFFRGLQKLNESTIREKYSIEFVKTIDLLMADKNVPNVIIATPVDTHYELTKKALLNSKNVLVEKPLALKPSECKELLKIASERNLKLETEYTYTYSNSLLNAHKIIADGLIGEINSIVLKKKQLGRFLAYDVFALLGTHCLSMLDMFLPISELNFNSKSLMTNDNMTSATLIYFEHLSKKSCGYIDVSLHCPIRENKVIICGQDGTITYNPDSKNTLSLVCYSRSQEKGTNKVKISQEKNFYFDEGNNLQFAIKNYSNLLEGNVADNSQRAAIITEIISSLRKNNQYKGKNQ